MSLKNTLSDAIKTAMKAKQMDKIKVLRNVQAAIKQIEIDQQVELDDVAVMQILQKQVKQRQESLSIYQNNNRPDLAQKEQYELELISEFLPKSLDEDELLSIIHQVIDALQANSMADMGKVMNAVKEQTAGRADPAIISRHVKQALTQPS